MHAGEIWSLTGVRVKEVGNPIQHFHLLVDQFVTPYVLSYHNSLAIPANTGSSKLLATPVFCAGRESSYKVSNHPFHLIVSRQAGSITPPLLPHNDPKVE
jgi:hypothetical protein